MNNLTLERTKSGSATLGVIAPSQSRTLEIRHLSAFYGKSKAINDVTMTCQPNKITAVIGPSGCGKSTLIRSLNRMHEVIRGAYATGEVLLDGEDIYARNADPVLVRRRIGMVFQKPNPFPTMSVSDNVIVGLKLNGGKPRGVDYDEIVERSLKSVALWDEVKDKLRTSGAALSGGQQQRLCIARAITVKPEVILMDEPCSALDPISTLRIEELMRELKQFYTIVIVTHNMQQAARVSDFTAFMLLNEWREGELIEYGRTEKIFNNPSDTRTEDYITGRFG
jgi:phosphate transport system ATP-binding protein